MKKVLKILCIILVISLGISLAACSKTESEKDISRIEETQSTSNTAGSALTTKNQSETFSKNETNYGVPETTETHYNHSAIQGCVILSRMEHRCFNILKSARTADMLVQASIQFITIWITIPRAFCAHNAKTIKPLKSRLINTKKIIYLTIKKYNTIHLK